MSVDLVSTAQPHYIPGYTGYCPQYRYRIADTYGSQTHKLLVDPTINRSEKLVLSDRTRDDFQVYRPPQRDIDIVESRFRHGDAIYKHPTIPGYEGFIPRMNAKFGQRYTVSATEAISEFERCQMRDREALNLLRRQVSLQSGGYRPKNLEDKTLTSSQFRLPLGEVRPEMTGILRNVPTTEPAIVPPPHSTSPHFMKHSDPKKYLISGYGGHVPFGYTKHGMSHVPMTNSALCDFTSNYRRRLSTEWAPVTVARMDPPLLIQPSQIYHKHVGLIPSYTGHIPGAQFRFGKTYGNDTKDAKRWLRGDYRT